MQIFLCVKVFIHRIFFRQTPFTLGWDIVGTVDKIGEKLSATSTWQIGDIVAALPIVGGYAQYLCVPSTQLVSVPSGVDSAEAVSIVLNYTSAYQMLNRCAHIKSGEFCQFTVPQVE